MRKRDVSIPFRLSQDEVEKLNKLVEKSNLNREAYIRQLINGVIPNDKPPPDYYLFMQQLYAIGNNLNQIAQKAHSLNVIDVQQYDKACNLLRDTIDRIEELVIMPRSMKNGSDINMEC